MKKPKPHKMEEKMYEEQFAKVLKDVARAIGSLEKESGLNFTGHVVTSGMNVRKFYPETEKHPKDQPTSKPKEAKAVKKKKR